MWLRNTSGADIIIPKTPFVADMIPGRIFEGPWTIYHNVESWRSFYDDQRGPFVPRDGGYWCGFDMIKPPSKALRIEEFCEFCQCVSLIPGHLDTISISPGEKLERELTLRIRPNTGYLDCGLFFDLPMLRINDKLRLPPRSEKRELAYREIDIWQGSLYVFLKIPD